MFVLEADREEIINFKDLLKREPKLESFWKQI